MQRNAPPRDFFSEMLACWEELEKIRAEAIASESTQTEPHSSPQIPVPRLKLVSESPSGDDKRTAFTVTATDSLDVPLSSTLPTLRVLGTNSGSGIAPSMSLSPSSNSSYSSSSSPAGGPGNFSLPDLPDDYLDELQDEATPTPASNTSPTPRCGMRRPSFMGEEVGESVREFRRRLSRKLSKMADSVAEWVEKASPRSGRNSPERASPRNTGRSSVPGSPRSEDPLQRWLPVKERNSIAIKLSHDAAYWRADDAEKMKLLKKALIEQMGERAESTGAKKLEAISNDIRTRLSHAVIDTEIDLADAEYRAFAESEAADFFYAKWRRDSVSTVDSSGTVRTRMDRLQPTFVRDFDKSDYWSTELDGSLKKITDINAFAAWVGKGTDKNGDLARTVSNVASQNLGGFLKSLLFPNREKNFNVEPVLKLFDGTPIAPSNSPKISYVFSKNPDGSVTLDYHSEISAASEKAKSLKGKREANKLGVRRTDAVGTFHIADQEGASLEVDVRISFAPDGEWYMENPRVKAKGWNLPET